MESVVAKKLASSGIIVRNLLIECVVGSGSTRSISNLRSPDCDLSRCYGLSRLMALMPMALLRCDHEDDTKPQVEAETSY